MLERLGTILRAYVAASFASGCALALGLGVAAFLRILVEGRWGDAAVAVVLAPCMLSLFAVVAAMFASVLAFVPALVIIGLAEAVRVRAAAFYGVAGMATAIVCGAYFFRREGAWFWMPSPELTLEQALTASVLVLLGGAAGSVGGLVYWHNAGRTAGNAP